MQRSLVVIFFLFAATAIAAFFLRERNARHQLEAVQLQLEQFEQDNVELQRKNQRLADELAEQRELLREQTLKTSRRSVDEFLALFPAPFPAGDWKPAESRFEDSWFLSADGLRLHGWHLRRSQPSAVVLHLHGNAGNLSHRGPSPKNFRAF